MEKLESEGIDISNASGTNIMFKYYESLGVTGNNTLNEWLIGMATKKYPFYTTIIRSIRLARKTHDRWIKDPIKKQTEIERFREEVGY